MRLRALAAICLILTLAACGGQMKVTYEDGEFRAFGWRGPEPAAGWASVFSVSTGGPGTPPMLGEYRRSGSTIVFKPRFPPSGPVEAVYRPDGQEWRLKFDLTPEADKPRITGVTPMADEVPANLLKLYIEFSRPMAKGEAYQHLSLVDDTGQTLADPFVEIDQELWDPAGKRLTVLFDPGRIKRGVKPNEDVGSPLKAGRSYRLIVGEGWHSASGGVLPALVGKSWRVIPSERRPIVLADWKLAAPAAGSHDPLVLVFPRPLDEALLADSLHVQQAGDTVSGAVAISDQARRWTFRPRTRWRAGTYTLLVETRLEDLAGNRIGRAFDVDTVAAPQARISKASESLAFEVR